MIIVSKELSKTDVFNKIENQIKKLSTYDLGWWDFKNQKKIYPSSKEWTQNGYFINNCRVLSPEELDKYKIGTCWDFTIYMVNFLLSLGIKDNLYIDLIVDKEFKITHSFIMIEIGGICYIIEPSLPGFVGIHKINIDYSLESQTKFIKQVNGFIISFYKDYIKTNQLSYTRNIKSMVQLSRRGKLTAHEFLSFFPGILDK